MPHLSAERLNFISGERGYQYQGNASPIELGQCLLGFGIGAGARVQQGAFKGRENQMTRSKQGREECNAGERNPTRPFSKRQRRTERPRVLSAVTGASYP